MNLVVIELGKSMVASPEVCRMNGSKSKGAVTKRGKAIASRNATKHGLLAKQPPLLVTEDLATFEGLVQGLIDQYQPANVVEHFLVQQVAMGMLKQYRLWSVEAAIANLEILTAQRSAQFPDVITPPEYQINSSFTATRTPLKQVLEPEQEVLERLISYLEEDLADWHQDPNQDFQLWLQQVRESSGAAYYHHDRSHAVYKAQSAFNSWLEPYVDEDCDTALPELTEVFSRVEELLNLANHRLQEVRLTLKAISATDKAIEQATLWSKGMQQQELVSRYQRDITAFPRLMRYN